MERRKKIAYLGPPGTFTHEAARKFFGPEVEMIFRNSANEVLHLYSGQYVENCVLAVESSITGTVRANLDQLQRLKEWFIVGEVLLPVHHHLMAGPGTELRRIRVVKGHPVAIEESRLWLRQNLADVSLEPISSSALAALEVSREGSSEIAAVAPGMAAELYGLEILASDIEDIYDNVTRFWVFGTQSPPPTGTDKTTLTVDGDPDPVLRGLAAAGIPILCIYERPTGRSIGSRFYWIDVDCRNDNPPLKYFFDQHLTAKYRGSYSEVSGPCGAG